MKHATTDAGSPPVTAGPASPTAGRLEALCFLRVPTWLPFRLQFYLNGHAGLTRQFDAANGSYTLADARDPRALHAERDALTRQYESVIVARY